MSKLILFDCDSTLSRIEGVDEMARLRGEKVFREIEQMTNLAMDGKIPLSEIFGQRLELVRPSRQETEAIGRAYIDSVEPTALEVVTTLKQVGWEVVIVSGGYRQAIRPFADFLGIERIEAVDLYFEKDGSYRTFDRDYPATRNGGKLEIVEALKAEKKFSQVIMVGDGASDLEAKPVVDLFVGFGGFVEREIVKKEADHFIRSLSEILPLLKVETK